MRQELERIKILKKQIFGETETIITCCFGCGAYVGQGSMSRDSTALFRVYPLCKNCFESKFTKIASPRFKP